MPTARFQIDILANINRSMAHSIIGQHKSRLEIGFTQWMHADNGRGSVAFSLHSILCRHVRFSGVCSCSAGVCFTQLALHEMHHRAQLMAMLRISGAAILEDLDYNALMFERRETMEGAEGHVPGQPN